MKKSTQARQKAAKEAAAKHASTFSLARRHSNRRSNPSLPVPLITKAFSAISNEQMTAISRLIMAGKKIQAIKALRSNNAALGLREAVQIVDEWDKFATKMGCKAPKRGYNTAMTSK